MGFFARDVLSAPASNTEIHTLNSVILAVAVLSVIGAGWIILSFAIFQSLRTFRHQLILGLAISDLLMAVNFLTSAVTNLKGSTNIGDMDLKGFCSFNGFMIQTFVVQTDWWVLTIALCTYLILANPKNQSSWIQEHRAIIWFMPWFFSLLISGLGLGLIGYGDIGACTDRTRLLINFIPRWIIILTILGLYFRLYFLIHRAHNRFMSFDDDAINSPHSGGSLNVSIRVDGECEWGARVTHTRIGKASPVLKRISYQMMTYPLVYMMIWVIPTTIRIYQSVSGKPAPFRLGTVDKSCIVIQGFADAIIYGINERTWNIWRGLFRKGSER